MQFLNHNSLGLESFALPRMFSSIVPILVIATPGVVAASVVSNTASVTAPGGAIEVNATDNAVEDTDTLYVQIIAEADNVGDVDGRAGQTNVINVYDNDTINGDQASPGNSTLALAAGSVLPDGISFDPATGQVDVAPGTPEGDYTFDYTICDIAVPDNCETATVTIAVPPYVSNLSGTVFKDLDSDREIGAEDLRLGGWTVEIYNGDELVATTTTDENGFYEFLELLSSPDYMIKFRHPDTGVVFEMIEDIQLEVASTLPDQNLPIDPSGVVYDSVTRAPVAGAIATLVDRNGNPLPEDCYLDPTQRNQITGPNGEYRFDIVPGAASACPVGETEYVIEITPPAGYSFTSTILPPQSDSFDPTGMGSPTPVSSSPLAPTEASPIYYLSFLLQSGDPDVINNHIALDPFLSRDELMVTKTSPKRSASTGDLVPYEITVRNEEPYQRADVDVVDVLPAGLTYITGTATVDGIAVEPELANGNRELIWRDQTIPANSTVSYRLTLIVGAGVTQGQAVNTGLAENGSDGDEISNRATATVQIVPSTLFDCSELIGQVFEDYNGNGYQDDGEPGIPSVRLANVKGELITTDEYGRYHIACAAVPDARIGSNYVLKLDEGTLPQGWIITTDNPRSVRLTRGKMSELNFGATEADRVSLDIDEQAFNAEGTLTSQALTRFQSLKEMEAKAMVVRATYRIDASMDSETVRDRIEAIRTALKDVFATGWDGPAPAIQVNGVSASSKPGGE